MVLVISIVFCWACGFIVQNMMTLEQYAKKHCFWCTWQRRSLRSLALVTVALVCNIVACILQVLSMPTVVLLVFT